MMAKNRYQVRIRKAISEGKTHQAALTAFGADVDMSVVRSLVSHEGTSLQELIEGTASALPDWEIISVILVDTENSEQLGEDFDWDEVTA